jgi:hypothetical protein
MATKPKFLFVAVVGLTLKDGTRVEPGEPYPGVPAKWLIDQHKVEKKV